MNRRSVSTTLPFLCFLAAQQRVDVLQAQGECVLDFKPKQIQATGLPTNVLRSNSEPPPPGQCSLVLSGQDLTFPAPSEASNAEFYLAVNKLELHQSRIILNGYRLTVKAIEIISDGGQILSFVDRKAKPGPSAGQPGFNGLSSGNLNLTADILRGVLTVDLRGQDGGDGATGSQGPPGARGLNGSPGVSGVFGCQSGGGNGGDGAQGGKGGPGGNGGDGGNGGNLVVKIKRIAEGKGVNPLLDGGAGGQPGRGGPGGPPGQGGDGGGGNGFCGESSGKSGATGANG